jgi:hypothetical protein
MRTTGNRFLNAGRNQYSDHRVRTVRLEKNWQRDGLIWRTLATHPKGL